MESGVKGISSATGVTASSARNFSSAKLAGSLSLRTEARPSFHLRTAKEEVVDALKVLVERSSLRGTARATGHKKDTIAFWQRRAGEHADALREYLLHELHLDRVEVDELYTFVKKRRRTSEATSRTLIPSERTSSGGL